MFLGLMTCSMMRGLIGMATLALAALCFRWSAVGILMLMVLSGTFGSIGVEIVLDMRRSDRAAARQRRYEVRPKCRGCHAEAFCPLKPGGALDRAPSNSALYQCASSVTRMGP